MSTVQFRRSPRLAAPKMPGGEVHLESPPEVPRVIPGNIVQKTLPVVMIVAVLGMVAFVFTTGEAKSNPVFLLFPIMMLVSTVGMFAGGRGRGQAKAEMNEDRKDYLRYLSQIRQRAREAAQEQRAALEWSHPDPAALWSIASSRRMWERRGGDLDFCHVRICRGAQRLATRLVAPQTGPVDELEPITMLALRQFVRAHSIVPDLPISLSIRGFAAIGICGERAPSRGLARSMVAQLATFHTPEDLLIAVVTAGRAKANWEWAKWLPHVQHPSLVDGAGPRRMMAASLAQIEELLGEQLRDRPRFARNAPTHGDGPHIVIVIDGGEVTGAEQIILEEGLAGVTLLDLSESLGALATRRGLQLAIESSAIGAWATAGIEFFGTPDSLGVAEAEAVARALAPYRIGGPESEGVDEPLLGNSGLLELLGLPADPRGFDVTQAWRPRPIRDRLRVPIGIGEFGQPVELDIKEAAQEGMGPHGLCVGATGSGKSEFLRTLVLGLIATHSSSVLNLVLVDFKGGATFLGMEDAPHVAAVITNLADDLTQVTRMQDALAGEMNRRQELLRTAGNFANVKDYEKARENGADLDPLPALFIVIDEFSELLAQKPEFIDLFVAIGRLGRSLQMHLLLASQRLEEGKLRGLESHLSYRIGLKTFSAGESRAVLGVPDAYELPPVPGSGYLKFDTTSMERFKVAYVSGPYRAGGGVAMSSTVTVTSDRRPRLFVPDYVDLPPEPELSGSYEVGAAPPAAGLPAPPAGNITEPSVLDIVVSRLRGQGPPAHEVWLPPLDQPPSLDQLLPPLSITEDRGLSPDGFFGNGRLAVPVGIVDKPYEQRRDLLWADLSGAAGHAVVTGGPQSGKSTLLRSMLMSLALTHTAEEVQFFCIDFGGGTLASLDGLPHSGGVAGRAEPDTVRRIIAEVTGLLAAREKQFRSLSIDSMADFRARKQRGQAGGQTEQLREDPFGDVFLVIDGWHNFRQEFDVTDLEVRVVNLANLGLSYGVHVMIGATRWAEIRPALKDLLGTRFELRLGDPGESDIDRRVAVNVPQDRPGRGLSREKLHFLAALPRIDAVTSAQDVGAGVVDAVARIRDGWHGRRGPRVRLLPERIPYEQLPALQAQHPHLIPIGINEAELAPVYLDFAAEPHFLCFADGESGKTNLLRTIARGIVNHCTPDQARIVMVDYRRTMLGFLESEHVIGYGMSADVLTPIIDDVERSMRKRLPGASVTRQQLRDRSWWSGPELYILVDDYDLVATQGGPNPLAPLLEFLAQAKDVGLHLIVARRSGGAARALFEPVIARLRELSTPGIVMSGSPDEGPLLGNVKPSAMSPGRGILVGRKIGQQLVQVAWLPPD
ncbi:MAG TPA: type VII secretion protein EccCa [Pseudonocardiaceae bacterium]|nr:type VII secretion protein EccCa [Pseudonocardiaceae bacterium]